MDESIVQRGSGTSPAELTVSKDSDVSTPSDFWHSFHLFRHSTVEEFIFRYWAFIAIAIYLFTLLGDVIADHYYYGVSPLDPSSQTRIDLNWIVIFWLVGVIAIVFTFNRWRKRIPATFRLLFNKASDDGISPRFSQEYSRLLEGYQQKLLSKWRYLLIGLLLLLSLGAVSLSLLNPDIVFAIFHPLRALKGESFFTLWTWVWLPASIIFPSLLLSYSAGAGAWAMVVTALSLKQLTSKFDIAIQTDHPDNCGGLRPLGNFCFAMAVPILLAALVLGVYDVGIFFNLGYYFQESVLTVAANVVLVLVDLPLAIIAFFVPLWSIHRKMVARREEEENDFADKISHLEGKLRSSLDKGALKDATAAKEEMELVRVLNPDKKSYPTWPFNIRILVPFWTAVIVPFLGFVGVIVSNWDEVAKFLSIFIRQH